MVVALSGCGGSTHVTFVGKELPSLPSPAFTLHDDAGRPVILPAKPGHYVLVAFLYTHCLDVCPIIAGNVNRALKTATAKQAGLSVLAVSVDPKGDTAAAVRAYVKEHALVSSFHYLIGSRSQLAPVWKRFHIGAVAGKDETVTHQAYEFLIDPSGHERVLYGANVQPGWIVSDLKTLMKAS